LTSVKLKAHPAEIRPGLLTGGIGGHSKAPFGGERKKKKKRSQVDYSGRGSASAQSIIIGRVVYGHDAEGAVRESRQTAKNLKRDIQETHIKGGPEMSRGSDTLHHLA